MSTSSLTASVLSSGWNGVFDDNYLNKLRNGDEETATHFSGHFRRLLRRSLWGKFSWEQEEELIDTAIIMAIEKIIQGQPRDAARLPSYVTGICLNLVRLSLRPGFRHGGQNIENLQMVDQARNAEEVLLAASNARQVRETLQALAPRDRTILLDIFYHETDRDKVCRRYGIDHNQLRLILFRARQKFQRTWARPLSPLGKRSRPL